MSTKPQNGEKKRDKRSFSGPERILLTLTALFFLTGILIFGWYGITYLPVRQTSAIRPGQVRVSAGGSQCTLEIPAGTLMIRHPRRAAVGSTYKADAEVRFEEPLRFSGCSGGLPNWNINLEAQTTFVGSRVQPFASIRQPAFDREDIAFHWTFTPEDPVPDYQSHLWLRVIVNDREETVERWNILVRDFPMANVTLFGQPTVIWLIGAGFSLTVSLLLLILFIQKRKR